MDTATLSLVCKDLGITGRAIPEMINGRQYIAFSGYPGLRTIFPGTIYSANNRKIITMAIGSLGIRDKVINGGILTIGITTSLTILEAFLRDHSSIYELVGNLASDIFKIGISSVMGGIAGLVAGGIVTYAFAPLAAAITISVFVGFGLNYIDQNYKMTEKLISVLEDLSGQISKSIKNGIDDAQRSAYRGLGEFLRGQTGYRCPF
jgi:hypothetical protein